MSNKLLPGLTALVLALSTVPTVAMQADEAAMIRMSETNDSAGALANNVQFLAEREIAAPRALKVAAQTPTSAEQANLYYSGQSTLALTLTLLAGFAIAALALVAKAFGAREPREIEDDDRRNVWKDDQRQMLDADLVNLDSLAHGFPAR